MSGGHPRLCGQRRPDAGGIRAVRRTLFAGCLALAAVTAGCGSPEPVSRAPTPATLTQLLHGSSPPLAQLHAQANRLLGGGTAAFKARRATLHGYPAVVNVWASWCAPCRGEFPLFQAASARLGRAVAFLGIDVGDDRGDARAFLAKFPVSYPSYADPEAVIARGLNASTGIPVTVFFDRAGHESFLHQGAYPSERALLQDIGRYASG